MRIYITTNPGSKTNRIEKINDEHYKIAVTARPTDGKANEALIALVAEYFKVHKSDVFIVSGFTSRQKVLEIII